MPNIQSVISRCSPQDAPLAWSLAMPSNWIGSFDGAVTTIATVTMAFFTCRLWISTNRLWKETKESADISKKSLEIAEQSLTSLEGPFLYPAIETNSIKYFCDAVIGGSSELDHATVTFQIKNTGRTHAFPVTLSATLICGNPDAPGSDPQAGMLSEPLIESGALSKRIITRNSNRIEIDDCKAVQRGERRIFLNGSITYFDRFGHEYEQKYCLAWDYKTDNFMAWGPKRNARRRIFVS